MGSDLVSFVNDQQVMFNDVAVDNKIAWAKESQFAIQAIQKNDHLAKICGNNLASLQNAIINVSAIGISLNPASKHAYLVPRDNMVCLDISYMGLMHLAQVSGAIMWGQCKLVYAADTYTNNGLDKEPTHTYSAFGDRGGLLGGYCTVKTPEGDYLTHEMQLSDIQKIAQSSRLFNSSHSPWKSHFNEMARKTIVKQASKYWPNVSRLDDAIHHLNTESGEGLEVVANENTIVNPKERILEILDAKGRSIGDFVSWVSKVLKRELSGLDDLTDDQLQSLVVKLENTK